MAEANPATPWAACVVGSIAMAGAHGKGGEDTVDCGVLAGKGCRDAMLTCTKVFKRAVREARMEDAMRLHIVRVNPCVMLVSLPSRGWCGCR